MGNLNLNTDEIEYSDGGDFEPLPAGVYSLTVKDSEVKETKAGTGNYAAFVFEVLEGDSKGRLIFQNLNINNPNAQCQEIGRSEFKRLAEACGVTGQVADTSELTGKIFAGKVKIEISKDPQYGDRNKVSKFMDIDGAVDTPPLTSAATPATKPAWKK